MPVTAMMDCAIWPVPNRSAAPRAPNGVHLPKIMAARPMNPTPLGMESLNPENELMDSVPANAEHVDTECRCCPRILTAGADAQAEDCVVQEYVHQDRTDEAKPYHERQVGEGAQKGYLGQEREMHAVGLGSKVVLELRRIPSRAEDVFQQVRHEADGDDVDGCSGDGLVAIPPDRDEGMERSHQAADGDTEQQADPGGVREKCAEQPEKGAETHDTVQTNVDDACAFTEDAAQRGKQDRHGVVQHLGDRNVDLQDVHVVASWSAGGSVRERRRWRILTREYRTATCRAMKPTAIPSMMLENVFGMLATCMDVAPVRSAPMNSPASTTPRGSLWPINATPIPVQPYPIVAVLGNWYCSPRMKKEPPSAARAPEKNMSCRMRRPMLIPCARGASWPMLAV